MKKNFCLLLIAMLMLTLLVSCGSKEDKRTLDDIIEAYTDNGVEVKKEEKPIFEMIGAKDGVIFYLENSPVKVYEYEDGKALEKAQKDYEIIKDWQGNGKFLLETKNDKAIKIFSEIE